MEIKIEILDENNNIKFGKNDYEDILRPMSAISDDFVYLATQSLPIQNGDKIRIELEKEKQYLMVKLDESLNESFIFVSGKVWIYEPLLTTNGLEATSENVFRAKRHYLQVRLAKEFEIKQYRNLALNPHDQKESTGAYPHASANVETRNDATFFARNAIDGIFANHSHGSYPYQSWGINKQVDAALTVDFGRQVALDQIGITLRADFPHDSFWTQISILFDSGESKVFNLEKQTKPQFFTFSKTSTTKIVMTNLIKNTTDESPFPALTQLEAFGWNI